MKVAKHTLQSEIMLSCRKSTSSYVVSNCPENKKFRNQYIYICSSIGTYYANTFTSYYSPNELDKNIPINIATLVKDVTI